MLGEGASGQTNLLPAQRDLFQLEHVRRAALAHPPLTSLVTSGAVEQTVRAVVTTKLAENSLSNGQAASAATLSLAIVVFSHLE